jgi:hypothetical protein
MNKKQLQEFTERLYFKYGSSINVTLATERETQRYCALFFYNDKIIYDLDFNKKLDNKRKLDIFQKIEIAVLKLNNNKKEEINND